MLIYDEDCGFCRRSLGWMTRLGTTCRYQSAQKSDLAALGLSDQDVLDAAWFVVGDARWRGHEAIAQALQTSRLAPVRLLGRVVGSGLLRPLTSRGYAWVAAHRHQLPGGTPACELPRSA
ncbi:conserved hypothetical protein [metagenome]|uniref:DUF393 domain-containing protein n=1 Tax=metagenome TaxID=256318 RepID=A0A2P2C098_9ZZZZ